MDPSVGPQIFGIDPRLYAIGELTGGFFFENYPGGGSLARCAVFGKIAGEHAASIVKG